MDNSTEDFSIMGLFSHIFGDYSKREIKKLEPIVDKIDSLADAFKSLTDEEMRAYTDKLREDLKNGKTLDDILPEAFALVREADDRVLGKRPFRVQLMGGILLHQGRIAEMKTGEGKTLVATLPAYLNALAGNGVHIVTVNDYLARRDSEEMGKVYSFLGLTTGIIVHGQEHDEKRAQYACDITYATNNELGFDYLRDNMVVYKEDMVQRGHAFAIIDEVDSILIDEARTPLIISGRGEKSTDIYDKADKCVRSFKKFVIKEIDAKADNDKIDADYIVDEKARTAVLTKSGIEKAERFFNLENLSDPENGTIYHSVNTAIKAHGVMQKDVEYIVKDGAIVIVDSFTGRLMPGRRYNDGLHQAIEAKEGVDIQKESRTIATITFQNYFRMYKKLSGMTGTAMTEENEFKQIYSLDVVEVPTNMPMIRKDRNDVVYRSVRGKYLAIVKQIKECNDKGQPVLVGTVSIDKSELLSELLKRNGIKHNVLNAKQHAKEAEIVAQAGRLGAVTISTNMAGRGTDIMLGGNPEFMAKREMRKRGVEEELIVLATGCADTDDEEILKARALYRELYDKYKEEIRPEAEKVREAGGLFILGTERHESRRIDNQLRGRSGRQGDAGESRFFLSLEDDLLRLFGSERMGAIATRLKLPEDMPLDSKLLSGSIEGAQKRLEANNFARRKHVLTYDDVMNQQRKLIYQQRAEVLLGEDISEKIKAMITETVTEAFGRFFGEGYDFDGFKNHFRGVLADSRGFKYSDEEAENIDKDTLLEELLDRAIEIYKSKDALYAKIPEVRPDAMREMEKRILLHHVDSKWMDHLEAMDDIKEYVGLNSYAQRDPVAMYRLESANLFDEMIHEIREDTVRDILAHTPVVRITKRAQLIKPVTEGFEGGGGAERKPATSKKVGRNDPCPCGSGKKYKKCHGINEN